MKELERESKEQNENNCGNTTENSTMLNKSSATTRTNNMTQSKEILLDKSSRSTKTNIDVFDSCFLFTFSNLGESQQQRMRWGSATTATTTLT